MPIQSALALIGLAKQSAKGSPEAAPTFANGLTGGAVVAVDVAQSRDDQTSGSRMSTAVNRESVMPAVDFQTRLTPKSVGAMLYGALGSVATSGAGPYTHVVTPADDVPYFTAFGKLGANIYSVQDVKIDSLGFSFEQANPIEVAASGMGTLIGFPATFSATVDESAAAYLDTAAGTFKLDVDSGTPVTATIRSGSITIANNLNQIQLAGSIVPNDVFVGRQEIECSFELVPENLNDWRTVVTGSAAGTSAAVDPVYGSFEITFSDGTNSVKLEALKVAYTIDFPDADPAGGQVVLTLAGLVVKPSGAAALTATVINSQATY